MISTATKGRVYNVYYKTHLKTLREDAKLSRMDVVRKAEVSYQTVLRWEKDVLKSIDHATLRKLQNFFKVKETELIYEVDEDGKPK